MRQVLHILLIVILPIGTFCQSLTSLESTVENQYGKEKLETLIKLAEGYLHQDTKKAVKYAKQAADLADNVIQSSNTLIEQKDLVLRPLSYLILGKAYFEREQYLESKNALITAKMEFEKLNVDQYISEIDEYLARIDVIAREDEKAVDGTFFKKTFGNMKIGEMINETTDDVTINSTLKTGESKEKSGLYLEAIDAYQKAINLLRNKGDSRQITSLRVHIGDLYVKATHYDDALNYFTLAKQDFTKTGDNTSLELINEKIDNALAIKKAHQAIPIKVQNNLNIANKEIETKIDSINLSQKDTKEELRRIAEKLENEQDFEKSLEYYKLYTELQNKYEEEERAKELALLEQERIQQEVTLLKQDQEIAQLKIAQSEAEVVRQTKFRNNLLVGAVLLIGLAIAFYLLYKNKKRDHQKLQQAYSDLDQTKSQLEIAEKKIKTLLNQQVSGAVATALLKEEISNKIEQRFVCVMFLDIRDFTPFVETKKPEEIIQYQNDVFGFMIDTVEKHHGVINQLLGDGFMATFGAPISHDNDCQNAVNAAKEIVHKLETRISSNEIPPTKVGIGLHAGNVVTGNVGTEERKQYSITGNTVISAARIEQLTKELQTPILISKEVVEHLPDFHLNGIEFKKVSIKGRNEPIEVLPLT